MVYLLTAIVLGLISALLAPLAAVLWLGGWSLERFEILWGKR